MPRRLPCCAWCGKPLRGATHIRVLWEALPGKPEVGWCGDHPNTDPLWRRLRDDGERPRNLPSEGLEEVLTEIDTRGAGRLVRNKR